jgi:hypothetical protein
LKNFYIRCTFKCTFRVIGLRIVRRIEEFLYQILNPGAVHWGVFLHEKFSSKCFYPHIYFLVGELFYFLLLWKKEKNIFILGQGAPVTYPTDSLVFKYKHNFRSAVMSVKGSDYDKQIREPKSQWQFFWRGCSSIILSKYSTSDARYVRL